MVYMNLLYVHSLIRIFDSCIAIRNVQGPLSSVSFQLCPSSVAEHRYMLSNNNQTDQKNETGGFGVQEQIGEGGYEGIICTLRDVVQCTKCTCTRTFAYFFPNGQFFAGFSQYILISPEGSAKLQWVKTIDRCQQTRSSAFFFLFFLLNAVQYINAHVIL